MRRERGEQTRGLGGIYRRGHVWWVYYPVRGTQRAESTGSRRRAAAVDLLRKRNAELGRGVVVDPTAERQPVRQLRKGLFAHYSLQGRRSIKSAASVWETHLAPVFDELRACDVTSTLVLRYVTERQAAGAAAASITYSLRLLHRAFTLAIAEQRLPPGFPVPHLPAPPVRNARRGFFERADFEKVAALLPPDVADAARFAFLTGWRRGEVVGLEWRDVNLADRTVTLPSERSKSGDARTIGLGGALLALLERRHGLRRLDCPRVFHRDGTPLGDFRRAWATACKTAGVPGRLFHDLRRTAVRNLVRAGTPERVAMGVTGHKTRAVFDRYNIVDRRDTAQALARVDDYLAEQDTRGVAVLSPDPEKSRAS